MMMNNQGQQFFAASIALLGYLKYIQNQRLIQEKENKFLELLGSDENQVDEVEFLPSERETYLMLGPISTISLYQGNIDNNLIISRLRQILHVNPWLAGRLVKRSGCNVKLHYKKAFNEASIGQYIHEIAVKNYSLDQKNKFDETTSINEVLLQFEKYFVKPGAECINKDEVLFKILIIQIYDIENELPTKTAFLMTLSHVIGDGHNFYSIYSFFHPSVTIFPINPIRNLSFPNRMKEIQGNEYVGYSSSFMVFLRCMYTLLIDFYPTAQRYKINSKIFHHRKQDYYRHHQHLNRDESIKFISTNDYLSWWFLQEVQSTHGFMAVNCRQRVPEITPEMAGNYNTFIIYSHKDYQEGGPFEIRKSLKKLQSSSCSVPTIWETINYRLSIVTNWASFYSHVIFNENCPLIYHSPLLSNRQIAIRDHMIIFRSNEKELGLFIFSRTKNEKDMWLQSLGNEFLEEF